MKRIILSCIFFIMLPVFSQETHNEYTQMLVREFALGDNNVEIGYTGNPNGYGVTGFGFDDAGNLYIGDYANSRFLILNPDYSYQGEIAHIIPNKFILSFDANGKLIMQMNKQVLIIDRQGKTRVLINLIYSKFKDKKKVRNDQFIVTNDFVIAHLTDGSTISIPSPTSNAEENRNKIQNHVDTVSSIAKSARSAADPGSGLRIEKYPPKDNQAIGNLFRGVSSGSSYGKIETHIVFQGDKMLTRDYEAFYYYYNELRSEEEIKIGNAADLTFDMEHIIKYSMGERFLGEDRDGNLYWEISRKIYVFNKNGQLIDAFQITNMKRICSPAVHPNGDIYLMDFSNNKHQLYKVSRVW